MFGLPARPQMDVTITFRTLVSLARTRGLDSTSRSRRAAVQTITTVTVLVYGWDDPPYRHATHFVRTQREESMTTADTA
ncbi:hypothetical protein DOTSEDRAFT_69428 [Dothistroma septosporum NZE10]|uniref:Uncharacterized protein n=1 Tax=Dothistroma septosporum (strain NZE10 / CBS 128990) TaxID=675120 RepID=N1PVS2_DOTSN|nr:hypothetical protein DOTSEDRAFT_69428 [Dothistroma septosporum NZE10]